MYYDENLIPFYVGMGHGNRITNHLRASIRNHRPTLFYNKLNKMIKNNIPFTYKKVRKNININQAIETEKVLIKLIGRRDLNKGPLCNLTNGGEGHKGYIKSEELKKRISKWSKGKKLSEEHKEAISKYNLGKKHSEKTKDKISKAQKGIPKPKPKESIPNYIKAAKKRSSDPEYIKKLKLRKREVHGKKVIQIALDDKLVKIWNNHIDAAEYINGRSDRIVDVCKNKRKNHKKYKWKFYND